jgi:CubicO group peptidase (beta-lactamase class C family)
VRRALMVDFSLPRLPFVPDPLRRIRVPRDLDSVTTTGAESDAAAGGMTDAAIERIWKAATDLYRSGTHPAVQVCVRREGEVVLERAIGHARGNGPGDSDDSEKLGATPETPFCIFSGAKAITAFVTHKLVERGLIALDDPICEHIPGYEDNGKEGITIGHVLAHRAGVPNLPREAFDLELMDQRDRLTEILCEAKPFAKPGALLAYHAVSGGFILGEVAHRVTGKSIREVLAEEFLDPLGMRWTNYGVRPEDLGEVALNYVTGARVLPPISTLLTRALGVPVDEIVEQSNDPRFLTGVVPAGNTVTTAHELSRFYEVMRRGGELDGVQVIEPETIRTALTQQSHLEMDLSLGFPTRFSYGLMLGARALSLYGRDTQHAFGHLGFTNMLAWADPERALSCAVMTSGKPIVYPELHRFYGLCQRITTEAPKVEGFDPEQSVAPAKSGRE